MFFKKDEQKEKLKKKIKSLNSRISFLENKLKTFEDIEREYDDFLDKKRKLEKEIEYTKTYLKDEFLHQTLNDVFYDLRRLHYAEPLYVIGYEFVERPKCSLCDEKRNRTIVDENGSKYIVKCKCASPKKTHIVKEGKPFYQLLKKPNDNKVFIILDDLMPEDGTYLYITKENGRIIDKFDENNLPKAKEKVFFTSKEEAQKYVDYLNGKEKDFLERSELND